VSRHYMHSVPLVVLDNVRLTTRCKKLLSGFKSIDILYQPQDANPERLSKQSLFKDWFFANLLERTRSCAHVSEY